MVELQDYIISILKDNNYLIERVMQIPYGYRIKVNNGCIILVYPHKWKYCFQGKNIEPISKLLKEILGE